MLLVYYSGSTHAPREDHLRRTVHAATIKDSRPGHVFPFSVFVLFREGGLLDWEEIVFLGGTCRFEKQRWSLRDMGRGGRFLLSTWTQTQGFCLLLEEGRSQSISISSSTNIPWEVTLVEILQV